MGQLAVANNSDRTSREHYKVLLVEDDAADRALINQLLITDPSAQYEVVSLPSLEMARHYMQRTQGVDCILLDYHLPDGTAEMLIDALQSLSTIPAIVVLTGHGSTEKGLSLLQLGAADYLSKQGATTENLSRAIRFSVERVRSISLRQKLSHERHYNTLQSDFISILSHELKNPIHVINHSVEAIRRKVASHLHIIDKYLVNITASSAQMDGLLNQTAEFASFDPETLDVNMEVLSLYELAMVEIERFQALHTMHEFSIGSGLSVIPNVVVDRVICIQILQNIISNAVKYTEEHTTINFLFTADEKTVTLQVQDHGRGIPKADMAQIGQKFYRASNSEGVNGTGMGMYLVQSLMKVLGGSLRIQSRENKGTVISLCFPRE